MVESLPTILIDLAPSLHAMAAVLWMSFSLHIAKIANFACHAKPFVLKKAVVDVTAAFVVENIGHKYFTPLVVYLDNNSYLCIVVIKQTKCFNKPAS